ncbi:MAG: beta-ketoacyl-ACP synthase III [Chthonomonadales bacterium]
MSQPKLQSAIVLGTGMSVPERILSNADLEKLVDTNDEWIVSRTGISERRMCGPDDYSSTLGIAAAKQALENSGITADQVDLIICSTTTPDYPWPSTACQIQHGIGATHAAAFDLSAACSGYTYSVAVAAGLIEGGAMKYILVIGADTLTKQINWEDRGTCILFGDGAGATLFGPGKPDEGVLSSHLGSEGAGFYQIWVGAGGLREPVVGPPPKDRPWYIQMAGAEVYKFAVKIMGEAALTALEKAEMSAADVSLFIPHQANIRIINAAAERMHLPDDKVFVNVQKYGNTSGASIPMALHEAVISGRVIAGDVLVFVGFGAGLTWGANVIRWRTESHA